MTIKIGILGYGNLGRGVECAISQNQDTELRAVFTRRDPENISIKTEGVPVLSISDAEKDEIDVLILCGGSATDLPVQTPQFVSMFNVIDSFDTHARIPEHFAAVDSAAKASGKVGVISCGWDPGMFSLNRLYAECIQRLHFLGERSQSRTFRCSPQNRRRHGRQTIYDSRRDRIGGRAPRGQAFSDNSPETHP